MITSVFGWLATLLLIFRQTFSKMPLRCPFFIGCYLFVSFFAAHVPTYNFRCNLSIFVSSLILHWAFRSLPKKRDEGTDPHDSDTAFFPIIEIAQWKSPFYCKSTLLCGIGWGCKNVDIKILPPNDDAFFLCRSPSSLHKASELICWLLMTLNPLEITNITNWQMGMRGSKRSLRDWFMVRWLTKIWSLDFFKNGSF